jgi:hypothetical protein
MTSIGPNNDEHIELDPAAVAHELIASLNNNSRTLKEVNRRIAEEVAQNKRERKLMKIVISLLAFVLVVVGGSTAFAIHEAGTNKAAQAMFKTVTTISLFDSCQRSNESRQELKTFITYVADHLPADDQLSILKQEAKAVFGTRNCSTILKAAATG